MQFTPKKKRSLTEYRFNPYACGGKTYMCQYRKNIERNCNSTPRKRPFRPSTLASAKRSLVTQTAKRSLTPHLQRESCLSEDKIKLELSHDDFIPISSDTEEFDSTLPSAPSEAEVDPLIITGDVKAIDISSPAKQKKPIFPVAKDDIFAISDDEFDKENSNSKLSITNSSFYRKETTTPKRSTVLLDISPTTVKNSYSTEANLSNTANATPLKQYKFKRIEKETVPAEPEYPHMIGFPNYGNTCYLNSVLQSLMGLLPFMIDLSNAQHVIDLSNKSITRSLLELISGRQKCNGTDVKKALRFLKENIERVDEAFAGFKMQDANEFLTQMLDSVKEEVDKCANPSWQNYVEDEEALHTSIFRESTNDPLNLDDIDISIVPMEDRPDSHPHTAVINPVIQNFGFELLETYKCLGCGELVLRTQEHYALYVNLPTSEDNILNIQKSVEAYMSEDQREVTCEKCSYNLASVTTRFTKLPRILIVQLKRYEYNQEQYECVKVSAKVDLNLWLYLGNVTATAVDSAPLWIPEPLLVSSDCKPEEEGASNECIRTVVQEEENKFDNSSANDQSMTEAAPDDNDPQLIPLADIFDREEEDLQLAIKLSLQASKMCYSTDDTSDEASSEEAFSEDDEHAYRLQSVISHFGQTTSTGHYVADVLNCKESQWYHYDDETVAKLQEAVLLAEGRQKNAYIYFYVDKNLFEELSKTPETV